MAKWSEWFPDMLAHLPGCPTLSVERELRNAAIQFFEESRAWSAVMDPIRVAAGEADVELESDEPRQIDLVRLETAWCDGRKLDVRSVDEMDASTRENWTERDGVPHSLIQLVSGVMFLYPTPSEAVIVTLRATLRPAATATEIPDTMMKYRETIRQGAMARLLAYPGQPWTAPDMAMVNAAAFRAGIDKANVDASRAFGRARIASRINWC